MKRLILLLTLCLLMTPALLVLPRTTTLKASTQSVDPNDSNSVCSLKLVEGPHLGYWTSVDPNGALDPDNCLTLAVNGLPSSVSITDMGRVYPANSDPNHLYWQWKWEGVVEPGVYSLEVVVKDRDNVTYLAETWFVRERDIVPPQIGCSEVYQ